MLITHFSFDFRFGNKRRYGIDNNNIDRARANQGFYDVKRLLSRVRLGNEKLIDIDADPSRIFGIKRVFRVDKRR